VIAVIAKLGIEADFQHLDSLRDIAEHGVLPTPVLTINGTIKTKGRLLQASEIKALLHEAMAGRSDHTEG
jgi:hypothetical protein